MIDGRIVRFTPNGLSVMSRQRSISLPQRLRRRLGQRGEEAERAGVGDGRDQLGAADPLHAALDDRVLDAEHFGEARLDHFDLTVSRAFLFYRRSTPLTVSTGIPADAFLRIRAYSDCRNQRCRDRAKYDARRDRARLIFSRFFKEDGRHHRQMAAATDRVKATGTCLVGRTDRASAVASSSNAIEMS